MKMKKMILFAALAAVALLTACQQRDHKLESTGRAFELFIVCDDAVWDGIVGDTLRAILLEPVPMLNQVEPYADLKHIRPKAMTGLLFKQTNLMNVTLGAEYTEPRIGVRYDVYAAPQLVVDVTGPDAATVTDYLWAHSTEIKQVLELAERDRYLTWGKKYNEKTLQKQIKKDFGFDMVVPRGYRLRSADNAKHFMWLSYELPLVSQGIVIYSYPYTGKSDFELDSLVSKRDQFVGLVPGPADNSYMGTSEIEPDLRYVRIEGRFWTEMRGFWSVKGDFMGGPFVSYSTLDPENHRVVCIDMYVFSPKYNKRNYIRQMEHLIYEVHFPGDEEAFAGENTQP